MAIKKRLGEMLVEAGIIDDGQLHAALRHQRQWGGRLGGILVELKLASEAAIVDALALKFGFEIARLDRIEPYAFEQAKGLVPHDYAVRNRIFPMAADTGVLVVAMSDPTNLSLTDELAFKTGRRIKVCIAGENAIAAAIRAHFGEDVSGQREAIALDPDDDTAMEAVYDPIGATSSEQMSHFFDQPQAAPPAPRAEPPPPAAPRATKVAAPPARAPAKAPPPAAAPPPAPAPAKGAPSLAAPPSPARAPAKAPPPAPPSAPGKERTRRPPVLQLEDQPTGSLPLDAAPPGDALVEELQPIPLEAETELGAGELEPVDGEEPYAADAQAYATGAEGYAAEPEPFATGAEGYANGAEPYAAGVEPYATGPEGYAAGTDPYAADAEPLPVDAEPHAADAEPHVAAAEYSVESGGAAEGAAPQRDLTEEEVEILAALDRLAHGDEATPTVVRPAQLLAALIRLMMRKQWITEHELLDEILRG